MTEQRSAEGFGLFHVGKVAGSFNYFKPGRGNGGADEGGGFGGVRRSLRPQMTSVGQVRDGSSGLWSARLIMAFIALVMATVLWLRIIDEAFSMSSGYWVGALSEK